MNRRIRDVFGRVMGPAGSILIHVALVFALVHFVWFKTPDNDPEVEVVLMDLESADLEEVRQELSVTEEAEPAVVTELPDPPWVDEVPAGDLPEFEFPVPESDVAALDESESARSPLVLKGIYSGRTEAGRREALTTHARKWAGHTPRPLSCARWIGCNATRMRMDHGTSEINRP